MTNFRSVAARTAENIRNLAVITEKLQIKSPRTMTDSVPIEVLSAKEFREMGLVQPPVAKRNKYSAERCKEDGHSFDSKKEHRRYSELKMLVGAGHISKLIVHPRYALTVAGERIGHAEFDFSYRARGGLLVIEDCKVEPTNTALSKWKRRHFESQYELTVTLV